MPWWSLPETMRAVLQCYDITADETVRNYCLSVFGKCHNAFIANYIRPEFDLMAIQMLSKDGKIIDRIPAVPDADPGYLITRKDFKEDTLKWQQWWKENKEKYQLLEADLAVAKNDLEIAKADIEKAKADIEDLKPKATP